MNKYKIDILDDNTIEAFDISNPSEVGPPFLRQPFNPEKGRPWESKEEAQAWIEKEMLTWE